MSPIDVKPEIEHASDAALGDDDVIDGAPEIFLTVIVLDERGQLQSMFDAKFAGENFCQMPLEFLCFDVGEEAERADIDPANGHFLIGEPSTDAEQCPVAADRQRHVDVHPLDARQPVSILPIQSSLARRHHQPHFLIPIEIEYPLDDLRRTSLAPIRKYRYLHHCIPPRL